MAAGTLAIALGMLLLQQLADLPDPRWCALLVVLPLFRGHLRLPALCAAGFLWALAFAAWTLRAELPAALEGQDLWVSGQVSGLPAGRAGVLRFEFEVAQADRPGVDGLRLRLAWYEGAPALQAGERWRLRVRLQRPHGLANPGGFDYEGWLFRRGVRATGSVRPAQGNRRLAAAASGLDHWRQGLRGRLEAALADRPLRGILIALVMGDRGGITPAQWQVLTRTGTNHLVAISGLHVGLVAGLVWWLVRRLWARSPWLTLRYPAPRAATAFGLLAALGYSALAGFALPTLRALVMLAVVAGAHLSGRHVRPRSVLAAALALVLLLDPPAVLAPGLWLSFGAVAVILYAVAARPRGTRWRQALRVQGAIALGLAPVTLLWFQRLSLVAPLANGLAIPVVSLAVVPPLLLGTALLGVPVVGTMLLGLAHGALSLLWPLLAWLAALPVAQWTGAEPGPWALLGAVVGVTWLLAPRGFPGRVLGALWLLPLLWPRPDLPAEGSARVTVLDVGQGLAVVVRTHRHVLVYDAGPRYGRSGDAGERVVVPYLAHVGVRRLDALVLSHADSDHVGGTGSLLSALPVTRILTGEPLPALAHRSVESCVAGQHWRWDGVRFEMLHPQPGIGSGNARSCVLRVASDGASLLLTGDIEAATEQELVARYGQGLAATVVVAPHHGSRTSSSAPFLEAVQPQLVLYAAGHRNRFGFPRPEVQARYAALGARAYRTGERGALTVTLPAERAPPAPPRAQRQAARRYWQAP